MCLMEMLMVTILLFYILQKEYQKNMFFLRLPYIILGPHTEWQ
jgi:hypothetical protein